MLKYRKVMVVGGVCSLIYAVACLKILHHKAKGEFVLSIHVHVLFCVTAREPCAF